MLLADELLHYGHSAVDPLVVTTIVSTSMLQKVAAAYGAKCAETLTGFKWLAHEGIRHQLAGGHFAVGFEEAIGYSVGGLVRDKDGVSAALIFADLASRAASAVSLSRIVSINFIGAMGFTDHAPRGFVFPVSGKRDHGSNDRPTGEHPQTLRTPFVW